jgi:cytochrome c biogenesis protein CcdA
MINKLNNFKQVLGKENFRPLIVTSCLLALIISIINAYIDYTEGYNVFNFFIVINFLIVLITIWSLVIVCLKIYSMDKKNKRITKLLTAKDKKIKLSKSLTIGAFFALIIGYLTSEVVYSQILNGKSYTIGAKQYKHISTSESLDIWSKKRNYKSTIIIISFVLGASLSYTSIKEENI